MAESERLLTVQEVAARLRVDPETVRRWLRANWLAGFRPGGDKAGWRVTDRALREFVENRYGNRARIGEDHGGER